MRAVIVSAKRRVRSGHRRVRQIELMKMKQWCSILLLTAISFGGAAGRAEALPFQLIVPSEITINAGGLSAPPSCTECYLVGTNSSGWILAGDSPVTIVREETGFAVSTEVHADALGVGGYLLLGGPPPPVLPAEFHLLPHQAVGNPYPLFLSLLTADETWVSPDVVGLTVHSTFFWPQGFSGVARYDYTFALGQDVARYTVNVNVIPGGSPAATVGAAQRVSSVFDPSYTPPEIPQRVPEPSTMLVGGLGWLLVAAASFRRSKA